MSDLLVQGADHLWTGLPGAAMRSAVGADLSVRGGVIGAIGQLRPEPGKRVIDAWGCVIDPGWINTHHHLFQSLLKRVPVGCRWPRCPGGVSPPCVAVPTAGDCTAPPPQGWPTPAFGNGRPDMQSPIAQTPTSR